MMKKQGTLNEKAPILIILRNRLISSKMFENEGNHFKESSAIFRCNFQSIMYWQKNFLNSMDSISVNKLKNKACP